MFKQGQDLNPLIQLFLLHTHHYIYSVEEERVPMVEQVVSPKLAALSQEVGVVPEVLQGQQAAPLHGVVVGKYPGGRLLVSRLQPWVSHK